MFSYLLVWILRAGVLFRLVQEGLTVEILRKRNLTLVDVAYAHGSAKENLWTTCFMFYILYLCRSCFHLCSLDIQTGFMP